MINFYQIFVNNSLLIMQQNVLILLLVILYLVCWIHILQEKIDGPMRWMNNKLRRH